MANILKRKGVFTNLMHDPKKDTKENSDREESGSSDASRKPEKKYDTCRLNEERETKEKKNRSGNCSTEYDDEWSY